jgi:apolipoprotein N-acyltransferase
VLIRPIGAAAAGLALALAFEPVVLPWLVPFALAGFVLATRGLRLRVAWLPGLAFGIGFYFTHILWMRAVGTDAWLALAGCVACFYAVLGSISALVQRHKLWPLWFAASWTAVEVWRSGWPFSGMPWGRIGFAVIDTPMAASLPYVGAVGVSFLLALLGALLAWVVVGDRRLLAAGSVAGLCALLAVPVLLPWEEDPGRSVTIATVQGDVPGNGDDILLDHRQVTRNHIEATIDLAAQVEAGQAPRPDFVLWPENSTAVDPFGDGDTNAGIVAATAAIGVPVVVGALVDAGEKHVLNQGIVWDPVTGAGDRYTKWHPVPYGEYIPFRRFFDGKNFGRLALIPRDMLSGSREEPLHVAGVEVADAICFDVAYDDGIAAQLNNGAELFVVQTSNATFIHTDQTDQQFAITRVRAIESGRWAVVASTNGVTGVIGPDGEVVAQADPRTRAVLVEQVALLDSVTPAVRLVPWTGRVCVALMALGMVLAIGRRRPTRRRLENAEVPPAVEGDPEPVGAGR